MFNDSLCVAAAWVCSTEDKGGVEDKSLSCFLPLQRNASEVNASLNDLVVLYCILYVSKVVYSQNVGQPNCLCHEWSPHWSLPPPVERLLCNAPPTGLNLKVIIIILPPEQHLIIASGVRGQVFILEAATPSVFQCTQV